LAKNKVRGGKTMSEIDMGAKLTREQVEQKVKSAREKGEMPILRRATLSGTDLNRANLRGAILTEAKLSGADLNRANLREANLSGARYDSNTVWPEDVNPHLAMAVLVEE
jgi:uncharacterized protein YjbI with pentapeptide repeats